MHLKRAIYSSQLKLVKRVKPRAAVIRKNKSKLPQELIDLGAYQVINNLPFLFTHNLICGSSNF